MFCKHCGSTIDNDCIICPKCGKQVAEITVSRAPERAQASAVPNIIITNVTSAPGYYGRPKSKWVAFFLCLFLGMFGAHKFYEGKVGMGILYLFTVGLFGIGWFCNTIGYLFKPNPYFVY